MIDYNKYMKHTLEQAKKAYELDEVPIGSIIIYNDNIIAEAFNSRNMFKNSLYHAEILAINKACKFLNDWRLEGCSIFVTIEPCAMCAGAILQSRIKRLVYGAKNPKAGSVDSIVNILQNNSYNHNVDIISGIMEDECSEIMKNFFKRLR